MSDFIKLAGPHWLVSKRIIEIDIDKKHNKITYSTLCTCGRETKRIAELSTWGLESIQITKKILDSCFNNNRHKILEGKHGRSAILCHGTWGRHERIDTGFVESTR